MRNTELSKVTHYGVVSFGDFQLKAAVLDDGRRGFVRSQLEKALGYSNIRGTRFARILADLSPNALSILEKTDVQVFMPHGGKANWVSCEIVPEIVDAVIDAVIEGHLHQQRSHLVSPCRQIQKALTRVGIVALIDEATGYQYHREPNALQELFIKLIREDAADWALRFYPSYYAALCGLFGWPYDRHRPLPPIIGQITRSAVYDVVFPPEVLDEIKKRCHREKYHQWLTSGGQKQLDHQIANVEMIAKSSADYGDFKARCSRAFYKKDQQIGIVFPNYV